MNAIKKQLKAFWHYFNLGTRGNNSETFSKRFSGAMPALAVSMLGVFLLSIWQNSGFLFYFAMGVGCSCGVALATTTAPSAVSVAPYSPKQRVVFSLLSAILSALIAVVIFTVVMTIIILTIVLIVFLSTHTGFDSVIFDETETGLNPVGVWLGFLQIVTAFFGTYAVFGLKTRRNQVFASVGLALVLNAFIITINNIMHQAFCAANDIVYEFTMIGYWSIEVSYLPNKWAAFLVAGILAAGALAAAIYVAIRNFKSDNV